MYFLLRTFNYYIVLRLETFVFIPLFVQVTSKFFSISVVLWFWVLQRFTLVSLRRSFPRSSNLIKHETDILDFEMPVQPFFSYIIT